MGFRDDVYPNFCCDIISRNSQTTTMDFRPREAPFFWRLLLEIWPDRFEIFAHFISAQAPISVNMVC